MTVNLDAAAATLLDELRATGVVAILRGQGPDAVVETAARLHAAGLRCLEVTLDSPNALESIARVCAVGHRDLLVGAGTVLTPAQAEQAATAGAVFTVSPNTDRDVIGRARALGLASLPGAFTPTEVAAAAAAGATAVKLFPASVLGPEYVRALRAPLADVELVATGGIDGDNAAAFRAAGALGVGVGGWLTAVDDPAELARRARAVMA